MPIATYEGIVEKGKIKLKSGVKLPENVKVYVVVTDAPVKDKKTVRVATPHLARKEQAAKFKMNVTRETPNA